MTDGSIVVLAIDMGCQFFGGKSTKFAKEIAKIAVGPVKFLGNCIHLSAIARRENDNFTNVTVVRQNTQCL